MTLTELALAHKLLITRARQLVSMIYPRGHCVTAMWVGGGAKTFYTLDEVKNHIALN